MSDADWPSRVNVLNSMLTSWSGFGDNGMRFLSINGVGNLAFRELELRWSLPGLGQDDDLPQRGYIIREPRGTEEENQGSPLALLKFVCRWPLGKFRAKRCRERR